MMKIQIFSVTFFYFAILQCILSLIMLLIDDVYVLITYSSIVESFFIMLSVSGVLYFRYTRPDMVRPIKVTFKKYIYLKGLYPNFNNINLLINFWMMFFLKRAICVGLVYYFFSENRKLS